MKIKINWPLDTIKVNFGPIKILRGGHCPFNGEKSKSSLKHHIFISKIFKNFKSVAVPLRALIVDQKLSFIATKLHGEYWCSIQGCHPLTIRNAAFNKCCSELPNPADVNRLRHVFLEEYFPLVATSNRLWKSSQTIFEPSSRFFHSKGATSFLFSRQVAAAAQLKSPD